MTSEAPDCEDRFVEVGQGFSVILLGSRVLSYMMHRTVLEDVAS
jgi:hypothetical protein